MADSYTQFSESFDFKPEAAAWLNDFMKKPPLDDSNEAMEAWLKERGVEDECEWPGFEYQVSDGKLYIWSEDVGNTDNVALVLQLYLQKFDPTGYCAFNWAGTCSKMRAGEFGGGAVFVTAKKVEWMSSWEWVNQQQKRYVEREAKRLSKQISASSKKRSSAPKKRSK